MPVSARSVAWFLLMKFVMSERRASTAHAHRSRPSMILNRSEGFADTQADMNCALQFQCVIASMMAGRPRSGDSSRAVAGERVTMKQAAALLPFWRATCRGVSELASRAEGDAWRRLSAAAHIFTSFAEAEG